MNLGSFTKTSVERKRYLIRYDEWLDTGETITAVAFQVNTSSTGGSPIQIDAYQINGDSDGVYFFASFGDDGGAYTVDVRITTSGGQYKEDTVKFAVRDP